MKNIFKIERSLRKRLANPKSLKWWILNMLFFSLMCRLIYLSIIASLTQANLDPAVTVDIGYIMLTINNTPVDPFFEILLDEEEQIYLPLSKIFHHLELYLFQTNWQGEFITGTIPIKNSYHYFDLKTGQLQWNQAITQIPRRYYFIYNDDVYLYYEVLSEWLPVEVLWDNLDYQLKITPDFLLVSELVAEREELRDKYLKQNQLAPRNIRRDQAKFFSPGMISYQTGVSHNRNGYHWGSITGIYTGQLMWGDFLANVQMTRDMTISLNQTQFTYRKIPGLGQVTIGSSYLDFPSVLGGGRMIRGVRFTNQTEQIKYGVTNLTGTVPPGSEVELYNRGMLIGFQIAEQGLYNYANIALPGALNQYEIIAYTQEGRIIREQKLVLSREQQLLPHSYLLEGGYGLTETGTLATLSGYYGLNPRLSIGGSFSHTDSKCTDRGNSSFLGTEVVYKLNSANHIFLDWQFDLQGRGIGYLGEMQSLLNNWMLHTGVRGYRGIEPLAREKVNLDGKLTGLDDELSFKLTQNSARQDIGFYYRLEKYADSYQHQMEVDVQRRVNMQTGLRVKNQVRVGIDGKWVDVLTGSLSYSGWGVVDMKADMSVSLTGEKSIDPTCTLDFISKQRAKNSLTYSAHLNLNKNEVSLSGRMQYKLSDQLALSASWTRGGVSTLLSFQDIHKLRWPFPSLNSTSLRTGWIEGVVYLDSNSNGQWEEGEQTFPNVRLMINGRPRARTDVDGRFLVEDIPAYEPASIKVDSTTLDALYQPTDEVVWIEVRPSTGMRLNLGVVPCSGISGSLVGDLQTLKQISGKIAIVLLNDKGEEKYRCFPESDGFFVFETILPGLYHMKVIPQDELKELLIEPTEYQVEIPGGEIPEWFDGLNFNIK